MTSNTKEVINLLSSIIFPDYISLDSNAQFTSFLLRQEKQRNTPSLPSEHVKYSDLVSKINKTGKFQERVLVITNLALYNFVPFKYSVSKRTIPLTEIRSVIFSSLSNEVVVQVKNDYDYRYVLRHRSLFVNAIGSSYEDLTNEDLPMFLMNEAVLRKYASTRVEYKKLKPSHKRNKTIIDAKDPLSYLQHSPSSNSLQTALLSPRKGTNVSHSKKIGMKGIQGSRKEGWLMKKKRRSGNWDYKYFILGKSELVYYSARIKGGFDTTQATFRLEKQKEETDADAASPRYRILISYKGRKKPMIIGFHSPQPFFQWNDALNASSSGGMRPSCEGWVLKQSPTSKTWRKRYFVLRGEKCWYLEMNVKWAIDLRQGEVNAQELDIERTVETQNLSFLFGKGQTFSHRFVVNDSSRTYNVAAASRVDMLGWIKAIKAVEAEKKIQLFTHQKSTKRVSMTNDYYNSLLQEAPEGRVTLVFTDIQSSTKLWEKFPEAMNVALVIHDEILRRNLKECRGYEVKTEGDAFMVAFNSATDALLWCIGVQYELLHAAWPAEVLSMDAAEEVVDIWDPMRKIFCGVRVRMGLHIGEPQCKRNPVTQRMDYFGQMVNLAARISDSAHGGQIVTTEEVCREYAQVSDYTWKSLYKSQARPVIEEIEGEYLFKGIQEPVKIYQVLHPRLEDRKAKFAPLRTDKA